MPLLVSSRIRMWIGLLAAALLTGSQGAGASDAYSMYEKAESYFTAGELQAAVVEIKKALSADPTNLPAYTLLAQVYLRMGAADAAAAAVMKARELGADDGLIWPLRARALLQQYRFEELLKTVPSEGFPAEVLSTLLGLRGDALAALGRMSEAEESYSRATSFAPLEVAPHLGMIRAAMRKGDLKTARSRLERGLETFPDEAGIWALRGDLAHLDERIADALESYDRALTLDGHHSEARLARAGTLVEQGRLDDAAPELARLRAIMPVDPRLSYLRALFEDKAGNAAAADLELARARSQLEEMGEEAIKTSPRLLRLGGMVSLKSGALKRARWYLERCLALDPRDIEAAQLLARVYLRQGAPKRSIVMLEKIISDVEDDADVLSLLAEAYSSVGRYDMARAHLERALAVRPDAASLRSRFAVSQIRTGREEQGLAVLEEVFAAAPTQRPEVGKMLARRYLEKGAFSDSVRVTSQLRGAQPRNLEILDLHASALAGSGRSDEARLVLEEALDIDPAFIPAAIRLANLLAEAGGLGDARALLERLVQAHPDRVQVLLELARLAGLANEPEAALRWLEQARSVAPRSVDAALALVAQHLAEGRGQDALAVAEEAQTWLPEEERLLDALAQVHLATGRRELALTLYRRISRTAGFDALAQYRVAQAQAQAGAYDDALFSLHKGLKDDPDHPPSQMLFVDLLGRASRLEQGLESARSLRKAHPRNADVWRLEAEMLGRLARFDDAIESMRMAQTLAPSTRNVLAWADLLGASGDAAGARTMILEWFSANPDDVDAEVALADSYLATGELVAARRHYENVLAQRPGAPALLAKLIHVLDRQGDPGAVALARKAHDASPAVPALADLLGWLLVRNGRADEGLRYLRDAHTRSVGSPEIRYHIAEALAALGREHEALEEVRAALRLSSEFPGMPQAKALMERLSR
jgi:putative PEP-CTERM system TPR-repeat lipoprotein